MIKVSLTFLALGVIIDAQSFSYSFEGVHRVVWKSRGGGSSIFMFYCIFMTELFEGGTWGTPLLPLSPTPLCASMSGMVVAKHFAIQWAMLNWIMDNIISWLMGLHLPKLLFYTLYLIYVEAYHYHLVIKISFCLSQSDPIKRLPL